MSDDSQTVSKASKYGLEGGPVNAINRIHCFPPGNQLGEQWLRHVIRAIKPHQITTPRHRVSLRPFARSRARAYALAWLNLRKLI